MVGLKEFLKTIEAAEKKGKELYDAHPLPNAKVRRALKKASEKPNEKNVKSFTEMNFHMPGSDKDCKHCQELNKHYKDAMAFEVEHLGINRNEAKGFVSTIKMIRGIIRMMKNDKEF